MYPNWTCPTASDTVHRSSTGIMGYMGRRSEHSREELQQMIISSTLALIQEHGAEKVTVRQIAQAIGYTPGMLYSVFVNLQDIFLHVNVCSLKTLYDNCQLACNAGADPELSIQAMGLAYLEFAEHHTHQFDLLFKRPTITTLQVPKELNETITRLFALIENELRALSPERDDQAIQLGARALWSGVHGTAGLALADQFFLHSPHTDHDIVQSLVSAFVDSWKR